MADVRPRNASAILALKTSYVCALEQIKQAEHNIERHEKTLTSHRAHLSNFQKERDELAEALKEYGEPLPDDNSGLHFGNEGRPLTSLSNEHVS